MSQYTRKELSWLIQACDDYIAGRGSERNLSGFCDYFAGWCEEQLQLGELDAGILAYNLVDTLRKYPSLVEEFGQNDYVTYDMGPTPRRLEFVAALRKLAEGLL